MSQEKNVRAFLIAILVDLTNEIFNILIKIINKKIYLEYTIFHLIGFPNMIC